MLVPHPFTDRHQVEQDGTGNVVRQVADNAQAIAELREIHRQRIGLNDRQPLGRVIAPQAFGQIPVDLHHVQLPPHAIQQGPGLRRQASGPDLDHAVVGGRAYRTDDGVDDALRRPGSVVRTPLSRTLMLGHRMMRRSASLSAHCRPGFLRQQSLLFQAVVDTLRLVAQ